MKMEVQDMWKIILKHTSIFCTAPDPQASHAKVLIDVIDKIAQQVCWLLRIGKHTKRLEWENVMVIVNKEKKIDSLQASGMSSKMYMNWKGVMKGAVCKLLLEKVMILRLNHEISKKSHAISFLAEGDLGNYIATDYHSTVFCGNFSIHFSFHTSFCGIWHNWLLFYYFLEYPCSL